MEIKKIIIDDDYRRLYWNRNQNLKLWNDYISKQPSILIDDFIKKDIEDDIEYVIIGKPFTIKEKLAEIKILGFQYKFLKERRPENFCIERTSWEDLVEMADEMYYLIDSLFYYE